MMENLKRDLRSDELTLQILFCMMNPKVTQQIVLCFISQIALLYFALNSKRYTFLAYAGLFTF